MTLEELEQLSEKLFLEIDRVLWYAFLQDEPARKTAFTARAERLSKARTQIVNIIHEWID